MTVSNILERPKNVPPAVGALDCLMEWFLLFTNQPLHLPLFSQKLTAGTWKSPLWKEIHIPNLHFWGFQSVGFGGVNMFSRHLREGRQTFAPPKTNECPLKSGHFKRKGSSSTIFEGTTLSFGGSNWQNQKDFPFTYTGSTFFYTNTLLFSPWKKKQGSFPLTSVGTYKVLERYTIWSFPGSAAIFFRAASWESWRMRKAKMSSSTSSPWLC